MANSFAAPFEMYVQNDLETRITGYRTEGAKSFVDVYLNDSTVYVGKDGQTLDEKPYLREKTVVVYAEDGTPIRAKSVVISSK